MTREEREYLDSYDYTRYDRPSLAADMAVFSIMGMESQENYRKDPEQKLKLLLVRRGEFPYKGDWALPGGFCRPEESTLETAKRELLEETGVETAYLKSFAVFDKPDRDPRGWIISHAFLALINGERYQVHGGSDAWEAQWFFIRCKKQTRKKQIEEEWAKIENIYELEFICEEGDQVRLFAVVKEEKSFQNYHESVKYEIVKSEGLAFDHAWISLCAYLKLQEEAGDSGRIVFDLMPEKFTLANLKRAYETIQGKELLTANFRRKIEKYVVETEEMAQGVGHRPARLYKRNLEAFYRE